MRRGTKVMGPVRGHRRHITYRTIIYRANQVLQLLASAKLFMLVMEAVDFVLSKASFPWSQPAGCTKRHLGIGV